MAAVSTFEARYRQGGQDTIDYLPGSAVGAGTVVDQGGLIGVVNVDIDPESDNFKSRTGQDALSISGIYELKKAGGDDAYAVGDKVSWDNTANVAVPDGDAAESFKFGVCVKAATAAATSVWVRLNHVKPS